MKNKNIGARLLAAFATVLALIVLFPQFTLVARVMLSIFAVIGLVKVRSAEFACFAVLGSATIALGTAVVSADISRGLFVGAFVGTVFLFVERYTYPPEPVKTTK